MVDEPDIDGGEIRQGDRPCIVISANAFWNIANFRASLIDALIADGYRVLVAAPDPDPVWAEWKNAEIVSIEVDRSGLNPLRDLSLLRHYATIFRTSSARIFLGFTAKPNIYGSLAAHFMGLASLPNVSGLGTAFINPGPLAALVGLLYRIAFRKCPIVFFQNEEDRDLFVTKAIVRPEQARLVPGSGIDLRHFVPVERNAPEPLAFLLVGRLLGDKGVREFVEAARILKTDHPDWEFRLLGPLDPENRSGIALAEVGQWVAEGVIDYLGEAADVRPHLVNASAVVLPSYREGMPRSLLEAAAMARPLVATDVPGNRQLVRDGVNGLLCEARNAQALAEAMRKLGEMGAERRIQMGRAARDGVERDFDEAIVIRAYLDAIAQLAPAGGVG